jgi:hypothetical protein
MLLTLRFSEGPSPPMRPGESQSAQLERIYPGSWADTPILTLAPTCDGECRFVRVAGVLSPSRTRTCVALCWDRRPLRPGLTPRGLRSASIRVNATCLSGSYTAAPPAGCEPRMILKKQSPAISITDEDIRELTERFEVVYAVGD